MDRAVAVGRGGESIVLAKDYASQKHANAALRSAKLLCPRCRQQVFYAGGRTQAPHFRHSKNNPLTESCELYVNGVGGGVAQYERVPPPVFIRQKVATPGKFVIELGLKRPPESLLTALEHEGAVLKVSNGVRRPKEYKLTAERMSSGMFKVPLRLGPGFSFSNDVRLTHSSREFADVWGLPERIGEATVFSCNRESLSGRRVEPCGHVSVDGSVLIVSELEKERLAEAFPDIEQVGGVETYGDVPLNVFLATAKDESAVFLEQQKIALVPCDDAPELLWPPALTSSGETRPLFTRSDCLFRVKASDLDSQIAAKLYVHTDFSTSPQQLASTRDRQWMSACVIPRPGVNFVSLHEYGPQQVILIRGKEREEPDELCDSGWLPLIEQTGSDEIKVTAFAPCEMRHMRRGGFLERLSLAPGVARVVSIEPSELVRVVLKPVLEGHGERIVFEAVPALADGSSDPPTNFRGESCSTKQSPGTGHDKAFARSRAGLSRVLGKSQGVVFATIRKASK